MKSVLIICSAFLFTAIAALAVVPFCSSSFTITKSQAYCPVDELHAVLFVVEEFQEVLASIQLPLMVVIAVTVLGLFLAVSGWRPQIATWLLRLRKSLSKLWHPYAFALSHGLLHQKYCE